MGKESSKYLLTKNILFFNFLHRCYISPLVFTCFRMMKGRATFFPPETIVVSFLHLMMLFYKVIFNYTLKRQSVVLHFCIILIILLFASQILNVTMMWK